MERLLITQTLLSSWAYTFDCAEGYEEEAKASFLATLRREKKEPTPAILNGIEFEKAVYDTAAGKLNPRGHKWEDGIRKVAAVIGNAPVQVRSQCNLDVGEDHFLLYGILDALSAGTIYDVKFLNKSMGGGENGLYLPGKYLESPQHPAYFRLVPEAVEFQYLVSDGKDLYVETYDRWNTPHIAGIVSEFMASIRSEGLYDLYRENWQAK